MNRKKLKNPVMVVAFCYVLSVLLCLGGALGRLAMDTVRSGSRQTVVLHARDFEWHSMLERDSLPQAGLQIEMASTDSDPHMIYRFEQGIHASRFVVEATPNKAIGTMVLYYTTAPAAQGEAPVFPEKNKLWAQQAQDGSWYFDLPMNQLYALRLDPDSAGGVVWRFGSFTLLQSRPAGAYFVPGAATALLAVVLPAFASALVLAVRQMLQEMRKEKEKPLEE